MSNIGGGSIITREYNNFQGVDFSDHEVSMFRSPDSKNMWKNYEKLGKCIESRPDIEIFKSFTTPIYGMFFYTINTIDHMIVHSGTSLYDYNMSTKELKTIKDTGMNPFKSQSFIFNNIFYIKDGINYLKYDGETCSNVEGFIPTTSISRTPSGGGKSYQYINLMTGYRKNSFCADGKATAYYIDSQNIEDGTVSVWIDDVKQTSGYTVNNATGCITFATAPSKPNTDGEDNVVIQFSKTIQGYKDRILRCTILEVFDNRIFFSGNPDYPNTLFNCELDDPSYISDEDKYTEGIDGSNIKVMIASSSALWTFKEPSSANTTVFYHTPSTYSDANTGYEAKSYPSQHSSISIGCVSTGINFNDDIVMFSENGMEGISGDVTTQQVLAHRSSMVDSKLLQEPNYRKLILQKYKGYLLVIVDNHVYLADSRGKFKNESHIEYEWYYWELSKNIICTVVKDDILYLGTSDGIYTLTNNNPSINAYWTTCKDSFNSLNYYKTTNKRGCVCDTDSNLSLSVKLNGQNWESLGTFVNTEGYIIPKIKEKKWKDIQFKFESNSFFNLYDFILQAFVGSFVKR